MDNSSLGTSFDFNSQAGVMAVLAAVRQSQLTGAQKNELRDLVFLYANGGGDPSVKLSLEQKLAAYQIKPVALPKKEEPKPEPAPEVVLPFGSSRPAPSFSAPQVKEVKLTPEVDVTAKLEPVPAPVAAPTPVPIKPLPDIVTTNPISAPIPQPAPVAMPATVKEEVAKPVTETKVTNQPAAQAAPAPFSDVNTNYLDRIREIKTAVNSKVGNPVNLVDIDNAVGREYMNALLDAMKRLSGGVGQIDPAMERLEAAYKAVEIAVAAHEKVASQNSVTPEAEKPVTQAVVEPEVSNLPKFTPVTPTVAEVPVVEEVVKPLPVEEVVKPDLADIPLVREDDSRWEGVEAKVDLDVKPVEAAVSSVPTMSKPEAVTPPSFTTASEPVPETKLSGVPAAEVRPVAAAVPPRTPEDLPTAAMLAGKDADPLYAKDVDDGLEQLLSDWVLFKKSGLFGTGPKGREHPLFKKMAGLPIPLLLAGRFEGSTQEIKQSVTDYMNGWRYEQGIIYEQGETFEHYLRRVIKQILDLQKKQRKA